MYLYCVSASREYSLPNPPKEGFNTSIFSKKRNRKGWKAASAERPKSSKKKKTKSKKEDK